MNKLETDGVPAQHSSSRWMLSGLRAPLEMCVCELSAAPMSDKQDYYWTLSDRRTGRLTHSTDSRSYFIGPLISPSCLYSISSFTPPFSHLFSSGRLLSLLLPWWRSTGFHLIYRSQAIPSDLLLYLFWVGLLNCLSNTVFDNALKQIRLQSLEDLRHLHQAKHFSLYDWLE